MGDYTGEVDKSLTHDFGKYECRGETIQCWLITLGYWTSRANEQCHCWISFSYEIDGEEYESFDLWDSEDYDKAVFAPGNPDTELYQQLREKFEVIKTKLSNRDARNELVQKLRHGIARFWRVNIEATLEVQHGIRGELKKMRENFEGEMLKVKSGEYHNSVIGEIDNVVKVTYVELKSLAGLEDEETEMAEEDWS